MICDRFRSWTATIWGRSVVRAAIGLAMLGLVVALLAEWYPLGVDWEYTFGHVAENWRDPYALASFSSPPWLVFLLPHSLLPDRWGNAINLVLNIALPLVVIRRFGGGWQTVVVVFTSPPMLDLLRTNNVDWIPLLAMLLPPMWGLPLLAVKPQSLGGVAVVWLKKYGIGILVPLAVVVLGSLLLWGQWFTRLLPLQQQAWNFSPWPLGIPLGLYLMYRAWRARDEVLGAIATPFLTPYIAPYSLIAVLAVAGGRYRREALFVNIAFWVYVVVESRRLALC